MSDVAVPIEYFSKHAKIASGHLERQAIVYVRQSSTHQVMHHRESRERQYALVERAVELGWPRDRILVIDEDQGMSGKSADSRQGFQTILSEVSCSHVGLILGIEMSRLARSCKDWYHLLEICGIFETLLADYDGIYDPRDSNDRLLLGLKGTISEVELQTMRNRLWLGRVNKAQRGELFQRVASGYFLTPSGELIKDPDAQVQAVIALIFEKFSELKSCYAVLRYLVRHKIQIGIRKYGGPEAGELQWRPIGYSTLNFILHNPMYAGAYVFGRTRTEPKRQKPGKSAPRRRIPYDQSSVVLLDRLPAYISWEQFLTNQQQFKKNQSRSTSPGALRNGSALLTGIVFCGRCGRRLSPAYINRPGQTARYACVADSVHHAAPICQSLSAKPLDALIEKLALTALEPAAIELSLRAVEQIERDRQKLHRHWQQRLERAMYDAELARRQFAVVDPDNRLVAGELERTWEQRLREKQSLQEEFDRHLTKMPAKLSEKEQDQIRSLSADIPALWRAATSCSDRRSIIRQIIDSVTVEHDGHSECVAVTIRWAGGYESHHELLRPVASYGNLTDYRDLEQRATELKQAGLASAVIAERLNQEGFRTARRRPFSRSSVYKFLSRNKTPKRKDTAQPGSQLQQDEWRAKDLSQKLGIPMHTLGCWRRNGWLGARKLSEHAWIYWADDQELRRLTSLRDSPRRHGGHGHYPRTLTSPQCPQHYLRVR